MRLLLFLLMSIENVRSNQMYSGNIASFYEYINEFCPDADICSEGSNIKRNVNNLQPEFGSCCTDCSCGPNCEENGNCCFPESLKNNSKFGNYNHQAYTCLFPMTTQPEGEKRINYQSYYMVTSSPELTNDGRKVVYNTSCGYEKVAPWGNMYPVYSAKEKRIYKNQVCATKNGVIDGEVLDAVLTCTKTGYFNNRFMIWVDSHSIPDDCIVNFIYRGRKEDIAHLQCYTDLIDYCSGDDFKLALFDTKIQKSEVSELCVSGLVSPYKTTNMYANIFCHICNEGYTSGFYVCEEPDVTTLRAPDDRTFLGLIDGIFLTEHYHERKPKNDPSHPLICNTVKEENCRVLFCPSGQLRSSIGNCEYTTTIWYNQDFTLVLILKLTVPINVYTVFKITADKKLNQLPSNLKSPWPMNWKITKIFFDSSADNGPNVTEFQVVVNNKLSAVNPRQVMDTIKIFITKSWTLQIDGKKHVLTSRLNRDTHEITDIPSTIFTRLRVVMSTFYVTKLFLCNQVQLEPHEYTLSVSQDDLFNNVTKRRMYNGEFTLISSSSFKGIRARICVEDFMLKASRASALSRARIVLNLSVIVLYFINNKRPLWPSG